MLELDIEKIRIEEEKGIPVYPSRRDEVGNLANSIIITVTLNRQHQN